MARKILIIIVVASSANSKHSNVARFSVVKRLISNPFLQFAFLAHSRTESFGAHLPRAVGWVGLISRDTTLCDHLVVILFSQAKLDAIFLVLTRGVLTQRAPHWASSAHWIHSIPGSAGRPAYWRGDACRSHMEIREGLETDRIQKLNKKKASMTRPKLLENEKHRLARIGKVARPIVKMAMVPSGLQGDNRPPDGPNEQLLCIAS